MAKTLGVKGFKPLPRFKRLFRKLDPSVQQQVKDTLADLQKNPIPPGRRVKKMEGHKDVWEARVNDNFRLTFKIEGDTAILRNVGTHDIL